MTRFHSRIVRRVQAATALAGVLMVTAASPAFAKDPTQSGEPLRKISWAEFQAKGKLISGTLVPKSSAGSTETLRIDYRKSEPNTFGLAVLESPGIRQTKWVLTGRIRYQAVKGRGYLELWNRFPDGSEYFSRTLAPAGPMAWIEGTSDWRDFVLPFDATGTTQHPSRLTINLHLAGPGQVEIGSLALYDGTSAPGLSGVSGLLGGPHETSAGSGRGSWWNDATGGRIGGILGSLIGVLAAVIVLLLARGRAAGLVHTVLVAMILSGAAMLGAGVVALVLRQPYGVYYPLLLIGVLLTLTGALGRRMAKRRYQEIELRRISAIDATRY
ncbi:MAG: hypothetical protein ACREOU_10610 [Candidatus Eiseniibacteriota bacterium]